MGQVLEEADQYPDASHYVDLCIEPDFDADPITPLVTLAKKHQVVQGRDGVYEGVSVPNNFLMPDDNDMYLALSFDAVRQLAYDSETFSSHLAYENSFRQIIGDVMVTMDDPEHSRYKKLVAPSFSHRMVNEELSKVTQPIIDSCLDAIVPNGEAELIGQFTDRFPFLIIAKLFGVPERIKEECSKATGDTFLYATDVMQAMTALESLDTMYQVIIDDHRENPVDDLTTMLINTEIDGVSLTDEEICLFMKMIVGAGLDTTTRQTAILIKLLLDHPDQFELLKAQPELLEQAIWESLRFCGTGGNIPRVATKDTELCGVKIPRGTSVYGILHAANYDESRWKDPFKFDITRPKKPIMSFGGGKHSCLGQSLSIAEMKSAMTSILERMPNLRKDESRWHNCKMRGYQFRSPTQLPVKWDVPAL